LTRPTAERLSDIAGAIERIKSYEKAASQGVSAVAEKAYFDAILYRLIVIGEAIKTLPGSLRGEVEDVPWREVMRLRDLLAHHYQQVDLEQIRETCDQPLAALAKAVAKMQVLAGDGSKSG